jgi:transcriptional regulator with XRE-family HTH domain
VGLSASGIQRLNRAIAAAATLEKGGDRFTLEELSDRTGISTSTLSRLWSSKTGVDRRTLSLLFSSFNLDLADTDIQAQQDSEQSSHLSLQWNSPGTQNTRIRYPSGPVPLDSLQYVSRPGIDDRAMQELSQPGCVIRIKAPKGFGKTSLLLRLIQHARQSGDATVQFDLQQTETETLQNPHLFLRWFCTVLAVKLGIESNLDQYWDVELGSPLSTTLYVQEAILAQLQSPLVLAINEVNRLFEYPETAKHVLPLLRSWHEEAQHDKVWQKLRLVVVYSTDVYLPFDINQSPFNVGLPLSLPEFTCDQVKGLADLHQLNWDKDEGDRLFSLIGGNPSLVGIALYHLQQGMALDEILNTAATQDGIFRNHLQSLLAQINQNPEWVDILTPLISGKDAVSLDPVLAYQLEGLGIITADLDGWRLRCDLYRMYLKAYLFSQT